jgi:predicted anti-sigma-YlaC factor YlaD
MDCKHIRKKLFFYIDNELSDQEKVIITEHLIGCISCKEAYNKLNAYLRVIDSGKKIQVNPYLYIGIAQKIKDVDLKQTNSSSVYTGIIKPIFISVFIAISVFVGVNIGNQINLNSKSDSVNINKTNSSSIITSDYYDISFVELNY